MQVALTMIQVAHVIQSLNSGVNSLSSLLKPLVVLSFTWVMERELEERTMNKGSLRQ